MEQDKKLPPGLLSVLSVQQHTEHLGEFGQRYVQTCGEPVSGYV